MQQATSSEVQHYIKTCIAGDLTKHGPIIDTLRPILEGPDAKVKLPRTENRVMWFDPAMVAEPSAAFSLGLMGFKV